MAQQVYMGATITCSFGTVPSQLTVLPKNRVATADMAAATIMDHAPTTNVQTFGMCNTPSNPQVASATAAAGGVLTPVPCVPVTTTPWMPGSPTVKIGSQPALNNTCRLTCQWGGIITVTEPGQQTVNVP